MVNKVFLMGNLGADPELRDTRVGPALNFRMAVNSTRRVQKEDGEFEYVQHADWIPIVVFGPKQARHQAAYLQKGALIHLEGKLRFRQYKNADGEPRTAQEVVADKIEWVAGTRTKEEALQVAATLV